MPILRLRKHQATFSDEDILINPSDFNGLKLNDVVELKPPKGGNATNRILLQVRKWPEVNSYPNSVSIKDSIAITHLKLYSDVLVNIVEKKDVLVDSIEICFSNAYLARSYMWGLRNHLNNRCVYQKQKLDYLHIRSQICEIWAQGNKVSSGYVDDDTKIVFRSASSLVYLFIQMSSEMWDYDINGDLYCEKAINGFLTDLFDIWRSNDCSHDITIILFSRTFYDAESIEEFPKEMRECLQVDYKNRFYEDCYRVAFQNDRFDLHDWNAKLTTLKSLFNQYQKEVIDRHQDKYDTKIPKAYNSSASQGNFLEVLNMSLNVFEKHYFDRSFDRTGQLSVVVSPGVGVFEVDFEMTNLTKQRIIDNGIGSDLVCLGEQPLHTVPLLKFNSKSSQFDTLATCDVYNMPHWINLSFYSSQNQVYYSNFVPRIKLPTLHSNKLMSKETSKATIVEQSTNGRSESRTTSQQQDTPAITSNANDTSDANENNKQQKTTNGNSSRSNSSNNNNNNGFQFSGHSTMPDLVDYDDYDAQVFKPNSMITYNYNQRSERSILSDLDSNADNNSTDQDDDFPDNKDNRNKSANIQRRASDVKNYQEYSRNMKRQMSENLPIGCSTSSSRISPQVQTTFTRMSLVDSYLTDVKIKPESADDLSVRGYNVQSSRINRSTARPKALINPFDPSHMTIKLTPNRRRWTHVFPQGPTGTFIQQHHYQPMSLQKDGCVVGAAPYLADVTSSMTIAENSPLTVQVSSSSSTESPHQSARSLHSRNKSSSSTSSSVSTLAATSGRAAYANEQSGTSGKFAKKLLSPGMDSTTSFGAGSASGLNNGTGSGMNSQLRLQLQQQQQQQQQGNYKSTLVSNDTIRFAWCASGEQEWTPAITTGVDWKSLTMPACLPLTTDFFPSKTSLQNDYVIGEYNIDSSCIHSRYSLIDVYRELVCQRLQKGFQIILLPRQTGSGEQNSRHSQQHGQHQHQSSHHNSSHHSHHSSNSSHHNHHSSSSTTGHRTSGSGGGSHRHKSSSMSSSHRGQHSSLNHHQHGSSVSSVGGMDDFFDRERTEYTMSIGRIFHKLSLNGNTITVTQYRPRHPYPTIKIDYCYRFRAPFHEKYIQSWVHFKSEKLENYSWNYLDNYICARGESFELRSSLKFWRFRILILPSRLGLRKLHDGEDPQAASNGDSNQTTSQTATTTRHDLYELKFSDEERDALMESFVKLLEIINKTRRASGCRLSSIVNLAHQQGSSSPQNGGACSAVVAGGQQSAAPTAATPVVAVKSLASPMDPASPNRLNVQINRRTSCGDQNQNQSKNQNQNNVSNESSAPKTGNGKQSEAQPLEALRPKLTFESINMDIDTALRDARRAEWVHVQYHNYYEINQAFELVIKWMVASGAGIAEMVQGWSRKVGPQSSVHVVPIPWEPFAMPHSGKADPLRCPIGIQLHLELIPNGNSLSDIQVVSLQEKILRRFGFVTFHDLISTEDIERQFVHMSGFAFVALPNIVAEYVITPASDVTTASSGSIAKSSSSTSPAKHLPQSNGNDNNNSNSNKHNKSDEATQNQPQQQQPVLLTRTNASSTTTTTTSAKHPSQQQHQVQSGTKNRAGVQSPLAPSLSHQDTVSSPHEEYITRHIGGARQNRANRLRAENEHIEFIWSWNYMLTKRWRSTSTQDESYAVSLMQDFKSFCQNGDNRLVDFWLEVKDNLVSLAPVSSS